MHIKGERVKFGLIGCGRIGEVHAEIMSEKGNLLAVCDIDAQKRASFSAKFNVPVYTDYAEMLRAHRGLDLVAVCTPNGLHAEHAIHCLNAQIHVLCEKPMALTVSDCQRMLASAATSGRQLFVVKQNRFNPPVVAVKKAIDTGQFGKILSAQVNCFWNRGTKYYKHPWHGSSSLDGGIIYTQFSHFIDLLYWFLGEVADAEGYVRNFIHEGMLDSEDAGVVIIRFMNGALATLNYTINSFRQNMEGSITLFGEKGTVKIGGQYLNTLEYQQFENYEIPNLVVSRPPNEYGFYQGSMSNHDKVYDNIIEVLKGGRTPYTSAAESMKTIEIIEKIIQKNRRFNA